MSALFQPASSVVGVVVTAGGVVAVAVLELGDVPLALVAVIRKVYAVLGVKPVAVALVAVPVSVATVAYAAVARRLNGVTGDIRQAGSAVHNKLTWVVDAAVAVNPAGAAGTASGVEMLTSVNVAVETSYAL